MIPLNGNFLRFSKARAHEAFIRLGFEAAGFQPNGRQPTPEDIQRGIQRINVLFNCLFYTQTQALLKSEEQRIDEKGWTSARQLARYHLDFHLWKESVMKVVAQNNIVLQSSGLAIFDFSSIKCRRRKDFCQVNYRNWSSERLKDWFKGTNFPFDDLDEDHSTSLLRSYLAPFGRGSFHSQAKSSKLGRDKVVFYDGIKLQPSSEILNCGFIAANVLLHLDYMQSREYWEEISKWEEKLIRYDDIDCSSLCQEWQNIAQAELEQGKDPEAFPDHRKMVQLLTRPFN